MHSEDWGTQSWALDQLQSSFWIVAHTETDKWHLYPALSPFAWLSGSERSRVLHFLPLKECLLSLISQKKWGSGGYLPPTLPSRFWAHVASFHSALKDKKFLKRFLSRDIQFKHMRFSGCQGNHTSGCWKPALGMPAPHGPVDAWAIAPSSRQHPAAAPGGLSSPSSVAVW